MDPFLRCIIIFYVIAFTALAGFVMVPSNVFPYPWVSAHDGVQGEYMKGAWASNGRIQEKMKILAQDKIMGQAYCLAIGEDDILHVGVHNWQNNSTRGAIVRLEEDGSVSLLAELPAFPQKMAFDKDGLLYVSAGGAGLLSVSYKGKVKSLTSHAKQKKIHFARGLAIHPQTDKVYFLDATDVKYDMEDKDSVVMDMLEARPHGRLLAYDPKKKRSSEVLQKLYYPSDVTIDKDGKFALITEEHRYRVTRFPLKNKGKGGKVFLEDLPGYPTAVIRAKKGFLMSFGAKRSWLIDWLHYSPIAKLAVTKFNTNFLPRPSPKASIIALDAAGEASESWHSVDKDVSIADILEHHRKIYFVGQGVHGVGVLEQ